MRPEIVDGLQTLASEQGLSVEDYLQQMVERELPTAIEDPAASHENQSGLVWKDGSLVYAGGTPLPAGYIDNALRRSREKRAQYILGLSDFSTPLFLSRPL